MKERDVQRLILDWLAANRIWHMRLNTGAMKGQHKGKSWFVRFGKPGMADILAFAKQERVTHHINGMVDMAGTFHDTRVAIFACQRPTWIEVKAAKGVQSDDQKRFQAEVEAEGMRYVLARSLEDVMRELAVHS